ncbi:pancreatic triacylglycerol lipase isoform X1 [Osmia lignaria lignaria]|uniref:pancreatic triacylglycerol lipase isoform X1 n=1 Tax=Osmia lignaria lignaria TaxID=1437193 RepID=UPI001478BAD8|nr:pancreatic triacylglycerol lipase-like isoform X1 [Osmia lignaria]XP_034185023.1 pancreatic triacylglycerol lipase-like isoform X1 [Osmia lignaria]
MQSKLVRQGLVFLILIGLWVIEAKRSGKLLTLRNRPLLRRTDINRQDLKPKICYDLVGCFADPPPRLTLKRPPEHPNVIQTRFLLYTRTRRESPDSLQYGDDFTSILHSRFNTSKPLKVIIHGYKGSGSDVGAILLVQALLNLEDTSVLVLDWTRGAATTYQAAVANTELVGRQLGLVLLDAIHLGTLPKNIHIIGFSLGAHVAGCASEILKKRNILLGRITGLDPASPFFRNHLFREKSRKLDATDAQLVDIIHTDGSEDFADGFGLLKPLGHIDFFPNGGREQPGCVDVKNSVVVSHLNEEMLTKEIACSHLRAWSLFLESMHMTNESCKFNAWPCPQGRNSYINGICFPMESTMWSQEMGYNANLGPLGIYYLPTREEEPFCGQSLRASVTVSDEGTKTSGMLFLKMEQRNSTIIFKLQYTATKRRNKPMTFYNIAAAKFQFLSNNQIAIRAQIWYQANRDEENENVIKKPNSDTLFIDKIAIEDRKNNRWEYCGSNTSINLHGRTVLLQRGECNVL